MSAAPPVSLRRYRRRVVALGGIVFLVVFVVGAAITMPMVQNDLEDRVEAELVDDGVEGVTASFSGQDGTLVCAEPLADPDAARGIAEATWGVRAIALDTTCRDDVTAGEPEPESTTAAPASSTTTTTTAPPVVTDPVPDSLEARIAGDPLFSQLAELVELADLASADGLGGGGPFTVLAPTDAAFDMAFDELGADTFGTITSDPEAIRAVLLHHVADGRLASGELATGPLVMLDGEAIEVDAAVPTFTSGAIVAGIDDPATQLDIEASNGVIHAIDRVLLPPGFELPAPAAPNATVTYRDGRMTLAGMVGDAQRTQLLAAAESGVNPTNVIDELMIDVAEAPAAVDADRLAVVIEAMPTNLVSGTATLDGAELRLDGIVRDDVTRAALDELAVGVDVDVGLAARPVADETAATELEAKLNAFVAENPILFEPGSVALAPGADAILEQVAARALSVVGVDLVVVGHTDSDGTADDNQLLSDGRAATVAAALVELGLDGDAVASEGRGATEPVLDTEGNEDKAASRRVEFVVALQ